MSANPFSIIVAMDRDRGIGHEGQLCWKLSRDMQYFKKTTSEYERRGGTNTVIMGRKTWDSIPQKFRPLKNRHNVVISSQTLHLAQAGSRADSLESALAESRGGTLFVIGGAQIYKLALEHPNCQRIFVTKIAANFTCDVFFPAFHERFEIVSESSWHEENGLKFRFLVYENPNIASK